MASLGTFASVVALGGGGGGGAATVTVPGNALAIVARAAGTDITVTFVDPNTVTVGLPAAVGYEQMMLLATDLVYVFGTVAANELGWMTITAKGIEAIADSSDPGGAPDYNPVVGTVVLTPSLTRPIRVLASNQFISMAPITATFDSDGELSFDGQKNVRIVAPGWTGLSRTDWRWNAEVRPGPGQSWSSFSVSFTGLPGSIVNLATLL